MIKKIKYLVIFFIIISLIGCGYKPIFSKKDLNFNIEKIDLTGNKTVSNIIKNKLNFYKKSQSQSNGLILFIKNTKTKTIKSKDTKGNPKKYDIEIISKVRILDGKRELKKNYKENVSFGSLDNKYDEKLVEERLTINLSNNITDNIISELIEFTTQ